MLATILQSCFFIPNLLVALIVVFLVPIKSYFNLRAIQKNNGKVKGYLLLKILLFFQPTILFIIVFFLSMGLWRIVWYVFQYLSEAINICIYIFIAILGFIGLRHMLKIIENRVQRFYIDRLASKPIVQNMAVDMTKIAMCDTSVSVYYIYLFFVPIYFISKYQSVSYYATLA
ncbi:hypothetical protein [Acinetobacter boissieri]|uniref:Uncharacterized protein n=1 Tax=Acinetobacter boissieri TaxID=1219383 RepID=A0A1G6H3X1_9GAMM|nr:hypothetical protein [Acinetobacter boissieri]SDB88843.1 hypothetical protein SAMN05421733_103255 [Acinetobacter boissieri]